MIKNTFYIVLMLFIYSCSSKDGEFKVKGSVDIKDGDMVIVGGASRVAEGQSIKVN